MHRAFSFYFHLQFGTPQTQGIEFNKTFDCFCSFFSIFFGLIISFSFAAGCSAIIVALQHKSSISHTFQKVQKYLGLKQDLKIKPIDCDICGIIKCNRHLTAPDREPWRRLFISYELDDALANVCIASIF